MASTTQNIGLKTYDISTDNFADFATGTSQNMVAIDKAISDKVKLNGESLSNVNFIKSTDGNVAQIEANGEKINIRVGDNAISPKNVLNGSITPEKISELSPITLYDGSTLNLTSAAGSSGTIYVINSVFTNNDTNRRLSGIKIKVQSACTYKVYIFSQDNETVTKVALYKILTLNLSAGMNYVTLDVELPTYFRFGISGENNTIMYGNNGSGSIKFTTTSTSNYAQEGATGSILLTGGLVDFCISFYTAISIKSKFNKLQTTLDALTGDNRYLVNLTGKTILLFGDSRSSNDYTWYKNLLEQKTGATVLNKGKSGATPKSMITDGYLDEMLNIEHDICIMFLCGNMSGYKGTLGTFSWGSNLQVWGEEVVGRWNGTDTFDANTSSKPIQQIDYIVQKYLKRYFADKNHKLYILTDIPSKRSGEAHNYRIVCNYGKSEMIKEVCEHNAVPFIDTMKKCRFNEDFEPSYSPPTDLITNNGVYYMDGLHLNEDGNDVLTDVICHELLDV